MGKNESQMINKLNPQGPFSFWMIVSSAVLSGVSEWALQANMMGEL